MFYHLDLDCSSLDIFLVAVHFLLSSRSSTKLLPPSLVVIVEWEGRVLELPCPYRCWTAVTTRKIINCIKCILAEKSGSQLGIF
jgi:hypothetical protein